MTEKVEAARIIAKLLAKRRTPVEEVPALIAQVERALSELGARAADAVANAAPAARPSRRPAHRVSRKKDKPHASSLPPAPAPAAETRTITPALVRRTAATPIAPTSSGPAFAPEPSGGLRGVVHWFDSRSGQGTLRLAGLSHDMPVDATILAAFGIARLFKGQEIEAKIAGPSDAPKIVALHLANASAASPVSGGTVRDRHAKPVIVELKRESRRRTTARAEAEQLLPRRRARSDG